MMKQTPEINAGFKLNDGSVTAPELMIHCLRESKLFAPIVTDWHKLLLLAEKHGVLPLIHETLLSNKIEMPGFFLEAADSSRDAIKALISELEEILSYFAQHDILVMPLKGPILAEKLYGDSLLRPSTDLDILVRRRDFDRSQELLVHAGWVARGPADGYHQGFLRGNAFMELHFDVTPLEAFSFSLDAIWNHSKKSSFRGFPIQIMSDEDRLLYLCAHGLKHGFYRLIWSTDILRALRSLSDNGGFQALNEIARQQGLKEVLYLGCEMVREVFPKQLPPGVIAMMLESPDAAEIARTAVSRLLAGSQNTSIEQEIWSIYLQIEKDPRKRWHRRLKSFRPTREDYLWAKHHRIHRRLMPVLRPFRLLAKHGPRRIWRNMFPPMA